jgi:uncharacterized protein YjiS (DUF1127 family)
MTKRQSIANTALASASRLRAFPAWQPRHLRAAGALSREEAAADAAMASAGFWRESLLAPIGRLIGWITAEYGIRRAIEELATHDDRMLADIGLSRSDVEYAARFGRLPRRGPDGSRL